MRPDALSNLQKLLTKLLALNEPPSPQEESQLRRYLWETHSDCVRHDHEIVTIKFTLKELRRQQRKIEGKHDELLLRLKDDDPDSWEQFNSHATMLERLDGEIGAFERRLESVRVGREKRYKRREACERALSPLRGMPVEIISEILLCAVATQEVLLLTVSHVCRLWRHAAFSTPQLWTHLALAPLWADSDVYKHTSLVSDWISRSGGLPVSLDLNLSSLNRQSASNLLGTCVQVSERWKDLTLSMPDWEDMTLLLSVATPDVLERLHLRTMSNVLGLCASLMSLECAPALTALTLDLRACDPLPNMLFPWSQLTDLSLLVSSGAHLCLEFVSLSTTLTRCHLDFTAIPASRNHGTDSFPAVRLPTMHTLEISSGEVISRVLNGMTLSGLRNLTIRMHNKIPFPTLPFIAFLARSGCILTKLSLLFVNLSPSAFQDILPLLPELIELEVEGGHQSYFSDQALAVLDPANPAFSRTNTTTSSSPSSSSSTTTQPPQTLLLPRLQTLRMESRSACLNPTYLVSFVQTRWYETALKRFGLAKLRKVRVTTTEPVAEDCKRQLMACVEEGLDFKITRPGFGRVVL